MLKIVSTLLSALVFSSLVFAQQEGDPGSQKNLSEMKQKVLSHMDKAIAEMQNGKSCVSAATTREALKTCRENHQKAMHELRQQRQQDRDQFRQHRRHDRPEPQGEPEGF